jgi:hypothetical protein
MRKGEHAAGCSISLERRARNYEKMVDYTPRDHKAVRTKCTTLPSGYIHIYGTRYHLRRFNRAYRCVVTGHTEVHMAEEPTFLIEENSRMISALPAAGFIEG